MGFNVLLPGKAFSGFLTNFCTLQLVSLSNFNTLKMRYCTYFYILFISACLQLVTNIVRNGCPVGLVFLSNERDSIYHSPLSILGASSWMKTVNLVKSTLSSVSLTIWMIDCVSCVYFSLAATRVTLMCLNRPTRLATTYLFIFFNTPWSCPVGDRLFALSPLELEIRDVCSSPRPAMFIKHL